MGKMKETDLAMIINNQTYIDYLNRLKLIATSLFTWDGLDEVAGFGASRFLELSLYENGRACFIKDDKLGFLALKVNPSDKLNVYNLPEKVLAWSIGYSKNYKFDEIVYIINNIMELPTSQTINLFAYRLYDTERTIDVNRIAQKTPIILEGDPKSILSLKNAYMDYSGNTPVLFSNKDFNINQKINCIKSEAPFLIDKLENHKHQIWNEALTYLGIDNANTDKKERLITDEVESNNELINYYLNCFYKTRKEACDLINKKYGLNIKIKLNKDVLELLNIDEEIGGIENGEIYNND